MYRALYRKWRPQKFSDVIGQEAITAALANQVLSDKLGHAYLFTGTRGTGKTSCAKILAQAANCENRQGAEPCGTCPMCEGMLNGSILDVQEIDAASNNGVDDVRDLREETVYRPSRGRYRVYIIDEVHMLTTAAFNALLKTLEEPPGHVIFILATTEIHKVPATILSRCQRYDFARIPAENIAERLMVIAKEEGIELTEGAADLLARLGDGSMRDATSLLDTCSGLGEAVDEVLVRRMAGVTDKDYLFELSAAARTGNTAVLLQKVSELRAQSIDVRRLCEELVGHYRNLMLARVPQQGASLLDSVPAANRQRYQDEAAQMRETEAITAIRRLADAMDRMGRSPDPRIELELALFDLGAARLESPAQAAASPVAPQAAAPAPKPSAAAQPPVVKATVQEPPALQTAPAATGAPVDVKKPAVEAAPPAAEESTEDTPQPFMAWPQVLERMHDTDKMLHSYMSRSTAYTDGKFILIDGGDLFLTFIRTNADAKESIRKVIAEVTGTRYNLGPYEAPKPKQKTTEETLEAWKALGVEVEEVNKSKENDA